MFKPVIELSSLRDGHSSGKSVSNKFVWYLMAPCNSFFPCQDDKGGGK